jgi:hypothetical protein
LSRVHFVHSLPLLLANPFVVLAHLTCASLKLDRFDVAQRDIPRILEALLAFLGAVDAFGVCSRSASVDLLE